LPLLHASLSRPPAGRRRSPRPHASPLRRISVGCRHSPRPPTEVQQGEVGSRGAAPGGRPARREAPRGGAAPTAAPNSSSPSPAPSAALPPLSC
jgi:hypothetical protein